MHGSKHPELTAAAESFGHQDMLVLMKIVVYSIVSMLLILCWYLIFCNSGYVASEGVQTSAVWVDERRKHHVH